MTKSNEKIILVGLGNWGPNYVSAIASIDSMELVAAVDLDQSRVEAFSSLGLGVFSTTDLDEAIKRTGATAAIVATPARSHYLVANQLMSSGLHVIVEKPLGVTIEETSALLETARRNKVTIYTGLNYLTHPCVQAVAAIRESGVEINHMQSERYHLGPRRSDVGVVYDLLPHDISIAMAVFRSEPVAVRAIGLERQSVSGAVSIEVSFDNGTTLMCNLSWKYPKKVRNISFSGGGAFVFFNELSSPGEELLITKFKESEVSKDLFLSTIVSEEYVDYSNFCLNPEEISMRNQPLVIALDQFQKAINNQETVTFSATAGHSIVRILEEIEAQIQKEGI